MPHAQFNDDLLQFISRSPTPFHAVQEMTCRLRAQGFTELLESQNWQLQAGGRYFTIRNQSSIVAFIVGDSDAGIEEQGIRMAGAHTDSPCLKVKPQPELSRNNYLQLGVEIYGGVLLNPWFDRELSLAGRVHYVDADNKLNVALLDFQRPLAIVPSLAIHLDRDANKSRTVNPQKDVPPLLAMLADGEQGDFRELLLAQLLSQQAPDQTEAVKVLDYEMSFYDCLSGDVIGLDEDFIVSARLDNLLSCYVGLQAIIDANEHITTILVCNDHEEVGSSSAAGAQGPMLKSVLERLLPDAQQRARAIDRSMLISMDNAHGLHPNYAQKHDSNHGPILNMGPVIKTNSSQRYASNSETQSIFRFLAEQVEVPVQSFVVRSDMACGSTIGPITAAEIGVKTLDVGVPQLAMHSIREMAGAKDAWYLYLILQEFYRRDDLRA